MILDEAYANKQHCNIIVTQPRRIAARSIASRISEEREWELGSVIGYQVNLNIVRIRWVFIVNGEFLSLVIKSEKIAPIPMQNNWSYKNKMHKNGILLLNLLLNA